MSDQPRERKQPPNIEGMFTLKVDNITQNTNDELLREKFSAFGEVGDVYIPRRRGSTDNRGYAFVRFLSEEEGHRAMEAMSGQEIDNSVVTIQEAKQPRPENPRQTMRDRSRRFDYNNNNHHNSFRGGRDRYDSRDRHRGPPRDRSRSRGHSRDRYAHRGRDYGDYRGDRDRDRERDRSRDRYNRYESRDYDNHHPAGNSRGYRSRSGSPRGGRY